MALKDMAGQTCGKWTVLSRGENTSRGSARWVCRCECGVEKLVHADTLRNGRSTSCGASVCAGRIKYDYSPEVVSERFWAQVRPEGDCWVWTGQTIGWGYGIFWVGESEKVPKGTVVAHRWSYEQMVGEIPIGLELDHLCRNKPCVNPYHLDPVTHAENCRRKRGMRYTK